MAAMPYVRDRMLGDERFLFKARAQRNTLAGCRRIRNACVQCVSVLVR
jgi:hypothetical protein